MAQYPDDTPKTEPIKLPNNRQTTLALSFDYKGKRALEPGDKVHVRSSAVSVLGAHLNHETGVISVVPVDGAVGPASVTANLTLADGTVLPEQIQAYEVTNPDAQAIVLKPGTEAAKAAPVPHPVQNAEAHTVPQKVEPEPKPAKTVKSDF